jgi:hypothetical protein
MSIPFDMKSFQLDINRRTFLGRAAYGLGGIALASLLDPKPPRMAIGKVWLIPRIFQSEPSASFTSAWRVARLISKVSIGSPS